MEAAGFHSKAGDHAPGDGSNAGSLAGRGLMFFHLFAAPVQGPSYRL